MSNWKKGTIALVFALALVLLTNPEWVACLLTLQAIGFETFVILLGLQARLAGGALRSVLPDRDSLVAFLTEDVQRGARSLLHLCPRPEQAFMLQQLGLLARLRLRRV